MERKKRLHHTKRGWGLLIGFLGLLLIVVVALSFFLDKTPVVSVSIASDPVLVVSWERVDNSFHIVSVPSDTVIEGTHGFNRYSLESLWNMGTIEKRSATVFQESVEEFLGVPVSFYLGGKNHQLLSKQDPMSSMHEIFSPKGIVSFYRGAFASNMSPVTFFRMAWAFMRVRPDNVQRVDLAPLRISETLPDGSEAFTIDPAAVDERLGTLFEETNLRQEAVSVSILNTTATPAIATRVARVLGHIGILVIAVGNDEPAISQCMMYGEKKQLQTATAARIADLYHCKMNEEKKSQSRADLTVRVGSEFESRFLPFR